MSETTAEVLAEETEESPAPVLWEGRLAIEGHPTDDGRFLMEVDHRELPLSLMAQIVSAEGHDDAQLAAKITDVWRVETEIDGKPAVEIWGRGPFDMNGEYGAEIARLVEEEFLLGVSIDLAPKESFLLDPETYEVIDLESMSDDDAAAIVIGGNYLSGIKGTIMGATLVPFPAFAEARVSVVTASAMSLVRQTPENTTGPARERFLTLVAGAGPLKPPSDWFRDPYLKELTPLTITKEGRVYGHLADWDGCHTGFQGVCVPPFRSYSDYAYFNVGEIETSDGDLVPCGKLMFCMNGNGHAPIDESMLYDEIQRYYDDATKVGAFVRAGSDKFGTWLAGSLRSGLSELEIQHLRTHPPSGDWRPIKNGPSDLVAAFSVPIPGFPIARQGLALVASAGGHISAIITGPLVIEEMGPRQRRRRKAMLSLRLEEAIGPRLGPREKMRRDALARRKADLDDAA